MREVSGTHRNVKYCRQSLRQPSLNLPNELNYGWAGQAKGGDGCSCRAQARIASEGGSLRQHAERSSTARGLRAFVSDDCPIAKQIAEALEAAHEAEASEHGLDLGPRGWHSPPNASGRGRDLVLDRKRHRPDRDRNSDQNIIRSAGHSRVPRPVAREAMTLEKQLVIHSLTSGIGLRGCHYVALCLCPMLTACASQPVEWINVPLADHVYFATRPAYRVEQVEIRVPANSDLEYMLEMKQGHSVSYEWRSPDISNPELLLAEFHGHTVRDSEEPGSVMLFKQGRAETSSGYLVAPFAGEHGWYFSNETDSDITITLSLSGFYTIP